MKGMIKSIDDFQKEVHTIDNDRNLNDTHYVHQFTPKSFFEKKEAVLP